MTDLIAGPLAELAPGEMKLLENDPFRVGVYNCDGALHAIEDRCSHDDGPLCELVLTDAERKELESGRALTLPAYLPVRTFPVRVQDGVVVVEIA